MANVSGTYSGSWNPFRAGELNVSFEVLNEGGAYAASMVLAVLALATLLLMNLLRRKEAA